MPQRQLQDRFRMLALVLVVSIDLGAFVTRSATAQDGDASLSDETEPRPADTQILLAVDRHIRQGPAKGIYALSSRKSAQTLELRRERLLGSTVRHTGPGRWALCGEFVTRDDHRYDLDFEVGGPTADRLGVRSIWTHKRDEVERYTWKREDGGYWYRKPVDTPKKKSGIMGLLGR